MPCFPVLSRIRRSAVLSFVALPLLAACEGETDPTGPGGTIKEPAINEIVTTAPLNASSTDTLVYFSFTSGALVPKSGDWDLALRRYEVRLNSPALAGATSRGVTGVGIANNAGATDAQVLAFTPANTLAAFDAIRGANLPADSLFVSDRLQQDDRAHLNLSGVPTANAANYWKARLANGSFAVFRVSRIRFTPQFAVDTLYIESRLQGATGLGPVQTLALAPANQPRAVSLSANAVVPTPSGCAWDLQFNPAPNSLALTVNTGCNVGTYPGGQSPTFANATAGNDAAQYAPYLSQLVGPIPNNVLDKNGPFRYNLAGNDRLHPTFNVFFARSGTKTWKFQVVDYYSNTGAPGFPTLRYARVK